MINSFDLPTSDPLPPLTTPDLTRLYKVWVQQLIDNDRLSEIIGYKSWLLHYPQPTN